MDLAPIAFFAYKRPEHTLKALDSLARCELAAASHLHIFCDGPKSPEDEELVRQVRATVSSAQWCGRVEIIAQDQNLGLAASIIAGTTRLCRQYGRVIVLEDDLLVAPSFLRYMNVALEKYRDDEAVMQVSGYMFPVDLEAETDAVFLPFTTTWGWGTWQRAWQHFDPEMSGFSRLKEDKQLRRKFDLEGAYPYFDMVELQRAGKIDSWGIRWYLSTFLRGGLCLHPLQSLVANIGLEGNGTHSGTNQVFKTEISSRKIEKFPAPRVDTQCFKKAISFLKWSRRKILLEKIKKKVLFSVLRQDR